MEENTEVEKKGSEKFTEASDKFFGDIAKLLREEVSLQTMTGIERATAIAELIYKVNQSIKLNKDAPKGKEAELVNAATGSRVDRIADKRRSE